MVLVVKLYRASVFGVALRNERGGHVPIGNCDIGFETSDCRQVFIYCFDTDMPKCVKTVDTRGDIFLKCFFLFGGLLGFCKGAIPPEHLIKSVFRTLPRYPEENVLQAEFDCLQSNLDTCYFL